MRIAVITIAKTANTSGNIQSAYLKQFKIHFSEQHGFLAHLSSTGSGFLALSTITTGMLVDGLELIVDLRIGAG